MARKAKSMEDIDAQMKRISDYYYNKKVSGNLNFSDARRWNNAETTGRYYINNIASKQKGRNVSLGSYDVRRYKDNGAFDTEKKASRKTYMGKASTLPIDGQYNEGQFGTEDYIQMRKRAERNRGYSQTEQAVYARNRRAQGLVGG